MRSASSLGAVPVSASPRATERQIDALVPTVDSFEISRAGGRDVCYYRISVIDTSAGAERCAECFRRFNQFLMLHERVRSEVRWEASSALPPAPRKHLGVHSEAFLQRRQAELQTYLRAVQAAVPHSATFWSFVGVRSVEPPPPTSPGVRRGVCGSADDADGNGIHAGGGDDGNDGTVSSSIETFDWSYRSSSNFFKRAIRQSGMLCGGGGSGGSRTDSRLSEA